MKLVFIKFLKKVLKSTYGIYLKGNYSDVTFRLSVLESYGEFYSKRLINIQKEFIFLDIGANQGLYSIIASQNPRNVKSFAFEPVAITFSFLNQNIAFNQVSNKCIPIQKAISNKSGKSKIYISPNHSGSATLASKNKLFNKKEYSTTISTINSIRITKLIKKVKYPIYVKIDVEGHEIIVIKELIKANLIDYKDEIFFDVDQNLVVFSDIKQTFLKLDLIHFKNWI